MERVQKLIASSGLCSRRKAEEFIAAGKVTVNGKVIKLGDQANVTDDILVHGKKIMPEKKVCIMLNKPVNYISAMSDQFYGRTLANLVHSEERLYHVGRLDKDARGMILLTNDGELANKIMHPRNAITKTYLARLDKSFTKEHKHMVEEGLRLKDGTVKAKVFLLSKDGVELTLQEGRHKIVKRIFSQLGFRVLDLKRTKIGHLALDVKEGRYRVLNEKDIALIFQNRGDADATRLNRVRQDGISHGAAAAKGQAHRRHLQ